MIEKNMPLKERKKILNHLQEKTTTFTQLHVLKDAMEAHEKLEKIEQIVNSEVDLNICNNVGEVCKLKAIREVLEKENTN